MNVKILRITILLTSILVFAVSLTQKCYCTTGSCGDSLAVFFIGVLGTLAGGAALTWWANPLLLTAWISVKLSPKLSLITSGLALLISLSFLLFHSIIDDEAGHYKEIIAYRPGYWLWVSSSFIMFAGNLVLRSVDKKGKLL